MITHTLMELDCNSTDSSIQTIDTLCDELTMYTGIQDLAKPVLEKILNQIKQIPEKTAFVEELTEELPEPVQAVICVPYGC